MLKAKYFKVNITKWRRAKYMQNRASKPTKEHLCVRE